ncbi:MAG: hypothetical protein VX498_13580 [Myxococcota bacterium]|nr:hypothetical protein [Myxococcota bacterium]
MSACGQTLRLSLVALLALALMGVSECEPESVDSPGFGDDLFGDSSNDSEESDSFGGECAPVQAITCGEQISGDTSDLNSGVTDVIDGYPLSVGNYAGPEITYAFTATADGTVEARFIDPVPTLLNQDIFILDGEDGVCSAAKAVDRGFNELAFEAVAGRSYFIVVDGAEGAEGAFELELDCSGSEAESEDEELSDVEWANQFFLTQIQDPRWNPSGSLSDTESNNCGPASLAMLMAAEGISPEGLEAETAIDHARAMMYPDYPAIDPSELPEGATLYEDDGLVLVDDDGHPVYFDPMETGPSLPQGISHTGASPVFGYSWNQVDTLAQSRGGLIAHGHITEAWVGRFSGEYGSVGAGAVPHFIAVFPASTEGEFVVCDPMHRGGAVLMSKWDLQTFFKSPISEYETSIRVVSWDQSPGAGE